MRISDWSSDVCSSDLRRLIDLFGETAKDGPHSVYAGGLWVRTPIDTHLQELTRKALRDGLIRYDRGKGWSGPISTIKMDEEWPRSEEHTSELQSLMRISYAVFCLKKKTQNKDERSYRQYHTIQKCMTESIYSKSDDVNIT